LIYNRRASDENEINKIREEETERGRRPSHSAEKEKRRRLKSTLLNALIRGNRGLFEQALIELGQKPGSADYESSIRSTRTTSGQGGSHQTLCGTYAFFLLFLRECFQMTQGDLGQFVGHLMSALSFFLGHVVIQSASSHSYFQT